MEPLPEGKTMAERAMIARLPDEAEAYLVRLQREKDQESVTPEQVAYIEEVLDSLGPDA